MLRFEFRMRISIIQDAFSAAELLLNSPGCDARSEEEYSAADFRQLNRDRTIFPNTMGLLKTLYLATWGLMQKPCLFVTGFRSMRSKASSAFDTPAC